MNTQANKTKNSLNKNLSNLEITKEVDIVSKIIIFNKLLILFRNKQQEN